MTSPQPTWSYRSTKPGVSHIPDSHIPRRAAPDSPEARCNAGRSQTRAWTLARGSSEAGRPGGAGRVNPGRRKKLRLPILLPVPSTLGGGGGRKCKGGGDSDPRAAKLGGAATHPSRPATWRGPRQCPSQLAFQESHPKQRVTNKSPSGFVQPHPRSALYGEVRASLHARLGSWSPKSASSLQEKVPDAN